jgi:hypothetical protein
LAKLLTVLKEESLSSPINFFSLRSLRLCGYKKKRTAEAQRKQRKRLTEEISNYYSASFSEDL